MISMLIPCAELKSTENVGAQECRELLKMSVFQLERMQEYFYKLILHI